MHSWIFPIVAVTALAASGDTHKRAVERLGKEADLFERSAHRVAGVETLRQRLPKGTRTDRSRRGIETGMPEVTHEITSDYGFVSLDQPGGSLKEVRIVRKVNGEVWNKGTKGLDSLAEVLTARDEKQKRRLLEGFESFGLRGFVTDLGQLILLFSRGRTSAYEITFDRKEKDAILGPVLMYKYQQLDGPEALTIYEGDEAVRQKLAGTIWFDAQDYTPLRISLHADREMEHSRIRDDAYVDYRMSRFGFLLPSKVSHYQFVDGKLFVEDVFTYADFKEVLPGGRP
jgi:hypothetical protein